MTLHSNLMDFVLSNMQQESTPWQEQEYLCWISYASLFLGHNPAKLADLFVGMEYDIAAFEQALRTPVAIDTDG